MSEIKRYDFYYNPMTEITQMAPETQGDWVRWDDVEKLLDCLDRISTMEDIKMGPSVEAWMARETLEEIGIKK